MVLMKYSQKLYFWDLFIISFKVWCISAYCIAELHLMELFVNSWSFQCRREMRVIEFQLKACIVWPVGMLLRPSCNFSVCNVMFSRSHVRMLQDPVPCSDVRERKCRCFFQKVVPCKYHLRRMTKARSVTKSCDSRVWCFCWFLKQLFLCSRVLGLKHDFKSLV